MMNSTFEETCVLFERRPRLAWPALQISLLPTPLRVNTQKFLGVEGGAVGAAEDGPETHRLGGGGGGDFAVDGAGRGEGDVPDRVRVADVVHRILVVVGADGA